MTFTRLAHRTPLASSFIPHAFPRAHTVLTRNPHAIESRRRLYPSPPSLSDMPRRLGAVDAASLALARALAAELNGARPRRRPTCTTTSDAPTSDATPTTPTTNGSRAYRHSWPVTKVRVCSGGYADDEGEGTRAQTRTEEEERAVRRGRANGGRRGRCRARDGADGDDGGTAGSEAARREAARLRKNAMSREYKAKKRAMMMGGSAVEAVRKEAVEERVTVGKKRRVAGESEAVSEVSAGRAHAHGKTASSRRKSGQRSKGTPPTKTKKAYEHSPEKTPNNKKKRVVIQDESPPPPPPLEISSPEGDGDDAVVSPTTPSPPSEEPTRANDDDNAPAVAKTTLDSTDCDLAAGAKTGEKPKQLPAARFIKCREGELAEFPPGAMVWVCLTTSHKGQWWPGRTWKVRQCAKAHDLLAIKPEGQCALVKLFGGNCFEWAVAKNLAPYDAQRQGAYRENMLQWYTSSTGRKRSRHEAIRALRKADEAEMADWSDPWSTSDDSSDESEEETEAAATAVRNVQALESMKVGLTPDWIVHATCKVFELELPTIETPLIKGLLDPCTNSHLKPNIPAEKCYDKKDDGLKMTNSWAGYHVLVNPPYEAQVQWRFINRAINEVEWEHCPGIVLVCRNSTDTSYFQRLLPFPRIHLRRTAVQFKDYTHCPIGFGICVFCIISPTHPKQAEIYARFHDEFHAAGEFNIPVDGAFVKSPPFIELTTRLHRRACESYRDSWIACDVCDRWREIPFDEMLCARKKKIWQCRDSFPMGCRTPLTRAEIAAFSVAKAETNTVLVASKVEGTKGPVGVYASEALHEAEEEDADGDAEDDERADAGVDADDERDVEDEKERTKEFIATGGKLHGLGCPCNWGPCRERRAKENKILSKTFPGLRLEWEKMRDELTNVLTPFEKARLEKIEANKNKLRSLMIVTEEKTKMTSHKVVHASAAESAALRMWDMAKRKQKTKTNNAEKRRRKVEVLRAQLEKAEKRLTDMVAEVREANQSVDTAVKVLEAIRARAKRVERELDANNALLKRAKEKSTRGAADARRRSDKIWSGAKDRVSGDAPLAALAAAVAETAAVEDAAADVRDVHSTAT